MARYSQLCRTCGGARWKHCKTCSGSGWATYAEICRTCGGSGVYGPERMNERTPAIAAPSPIGAEITFAVAGARGGLEESQARRTRRQRAVPPPAKTAGHAKRTGN